MIIIDMVKVGTQGEELSLLFSGGSYLWGVNHVNDKLTQGWLYWDLWWMEKYETDVCILRQA